VQLIFLGCDDGHGVPRVDCECPVCHDAIRQGVTTIKPLMDVGAALELIREVAPGQAVLTHPSHTVEYKEVSDRLSPLVRLAYDGLTVEVQE
jgi:phosphoribosyl 1,2-cyclic phosphodiesterase